MFARGVLECYFAVHTFLVLNFSCFRGWDYPPQQRVPSALVFHIAGVNDLGKSAARPGLQPGRRITRKQVRFRVLCASVDYCAVAAVNPLASFRVTISWVPATLLKLPVTSRFPNESKAASLTS